MPLLTITNTYDFIDSSKGNLSTNIENIVVTTERINFVNQSQRIKAMLQRREYQQIVQLSFELSELVLNFKLKEFEYTGTQKANREESEINSSCRSTSRKDI